MVRFKENELRAGQDCLNEAKRQAASRRKSVNDDLTTATYQGLEYYDRAPVSTVLGRWHGKPKPAICYVCETRGGIMYVEDGKRFCLSHKYLMRAPVEEIDRIKNKIKGAINVTK